MTKKTEEAVKSVAYLVSCGHPGCKWSTKVTLEQEIGHWHEPVTTTEFVEESKGAYVPQEVTTSWDGHPLEDAYEAHYQQVHVAQKQPPMLEWAKA